MPEHHGDFLAVYRPWTARRTPGGPSLPDPRGWELSRPETGATRRSWLPEVTVEERDGCILVRTDRDALATLWWVRDAGEIVAVSTSIDRLLPLARQELDPVSVFQCAAYGFRLGARSTFKGIERAEPRTTLVLDDAGAKLTRAEPDPLPDADECEEIVCRNLAPQVAQAFADGDALELTGGVDSRLNLALGLSAGQAPRMAFTIGDADNADALAAANVCEHFGIRHERIEIPEPSPDMLEQTRRFIAASDYTCNASSYGWLPGAFEELAKHRDSQLTGLGGEVAGGFYTSRADLIGNTLGMRRLWARLRVQDRSCRQLWKGGSYASFRRQSEDQFEAALRDTSVPWLERVNRLYLSERMRQWAMCVMFASGRWYRVSAPMLTDSFLDWCRAGWNDTERTGRERQRALIRRLNPELADLPHADAFGTPKKKRSLLSDFRRLMRGGARDMGAADTAARLLSDDGLRESVLGLADGPLGVDSDALHRAVAQPETLPRPIGMMMTAAIAASAAGAATESPAGGELA